MSKADELQQARELLERVATALPVLETMLKKASEIVRGDGDMGASVARDMLEDVRRFLKPKESGEVVVSGVHPHVPEPDSLWQPQRCRCGGTIRQQLMGALICGS